MATVLVLSWAALLFCCRAFSMLILLSSDVTFNLVSQSGLLPVLSGLLNVCFAASLVDLYRPPVCISGFLFSWRRPASHVSLIGSGKIGRRWSCVLGYAGEYFIYFFRF